jgi:DNA segregation ATPase FtsK/SpoIIIE, S-DNA-T family
VDGWTTLRTEFDTLQSDVTDIASRGLTFGVHVVAATTRWADLRSQVRDLFGTRLELRLGDPLDSEVDRRLAVNVPERPGRGLTETRHHFLVALPRVDGRTDSASLADGLVDLVSRVREGWGGPTGPRLRLLPEKVELAEVRQAAIPTVAAGRRAQPVVGAARHLVLGVDERALAPVRLEVDSEPHLLVLGDGGSGKTSLLRTYLREVMDSRQPSEAQIVVLDYRRTLLGEVDDDYLAAYYTSAVQAGPGLTELAVYLGGRLPGPETTAEQLRRRAWLAGRAELFVVVDDYELVAGTQGSPLLPLVEYLPQAQDVGLHLVLARRSGGASRAMYEPAIQGLRDLSAPGVVLPGNPEEGPLLGGVRPQPGPPGRARLVTRARGVEVIQVAYTDAQP